jgi:transposase InsO family protein
MDSIIVYVNKERHLFMSVIDIYTKYALVVKVNAISSINAKRVFIKFEGENPTGIHTVQTDNGSEFLAYLHKYLEEKGVVHKFIYPRMVKVNSIIERFNRTVQEECIGRSDELYYDMIAFEKVLTKYLYWYNYKRPHYALGYMSPMQFINSNIPKGM